MFPRKANYTRMSYPIMLSLAYLNPNEAMATLKSVVENGMISHKHKSSLWPINTDDISWAMAAWEIYAVTGDKDWLKWSYDVVKRTVTEEYEINADSFTGLIHGGGQYAFSQGQFYPAWMEYKDIYESTSLTNNVFLSVHLKFSTTWATNWALKANMVRWRKLERCHQRGIVERTVAPLFPVHLCLRQPSPVASNRQFAQAMSVLWNIASDDRAENLMMYTPISYYGIPTTSPYYQSEDQINLSEVVTPMVQAFWNLAAAKSDNETMLRYGLGAMYRAQALFAATRVLTMDSQVCRSAHCKPTLAVPQAIWRWCFAFMPA